MVTIYTRDECSFCDQQKSWFRANGIPFKEVKAFILKDGELRLNTTPKEIRRIRYSPGSKILFPVTVMELEGIGKHMIWGFDEKHFETHRHQIEHYAGLHKDDHEDL